MTEDDDTRRRARMSISKRGEGLLAAAPAGRKGAVEFTDTLKPLETLRDRLCVVSNLAHPLAESTQNGWQFFRPDHDQRDDADDDKLAPTDIEHGNCISERCAVTRERAPCGPRPRSLSAALNSSTRLARLHRRAAGGLDGLRLMGSGSESDARA